MPSSLVGRRSGGRPAPAPAGGQSRAPVALPQYQQPSCPLDASARKALGELSGNRGIVSYEAQLKESVRVLGHSVGDLHERLLLRRERLAQLQEVRRSKGTEKKAEEERLEAHLPSLAKDVDRLTADLEQALRQIIDQRVELEDEATVLGDMLASLPVAADPAVSASQREDSEDVPEGILGDADQAPLPPAEGMSDTFRKLRAEKRTEYRTMTPYQRYALNNDYKGFKKLWHDAAVGEDGPPLPNATKWFTAAGEPDMSTAPRGRKRRVSTEVGEDENGQEEGEEEEAGREGEGEGEEEEEEEEEDEDEDDVEVSVQREKLSVNCPLTLLPMKEPFKNSKCPHVFEKSAILEYLSGPGPHQCPQTGCSQTFSRTQFNLDFSLDEAMLRRMKRDRRAREALRDLDEIEDDDNEQSVVVGLDRQTGNRRQRMKSEH